ncbi:hypothetical protein RHGRI_019482 [Rhododendron griersonianum]|uniref:RNA polymerase sigma-70 domain-containing protein n=1 Tax=Rhododendron griersonianum TaxID=479676 RepID=A0AAV6JCK9_9ERIC|nr:hypothetical protein RHGRI_019482 [Rhododendron griersonianum]
MSCLLPQFKCLPDTFSFHPKTPHFHPPIHLLKCKESILIRSQCVLSTASPPTSTATARTIDVEKLLLLYLEDKPNPAAADRPWTYVGTVGPPTEANFGASLATETILTSEEATIAAAAAEAVALAKSAVRVAKEAAMMVSHKSLTTADVKAAVVAKSAVRVAKEAAMMVSHKSLTTADVKAAVVASEANMLSEIRQVGVAGDLTAAAAELWGNFPLQYPSIKEDDLFPINEQLKHILTEFPDVAVRSRRQSERKARRAEAAEKASAKTTVSVKSTSRKKRTSSQDMTDPLRYLRGTTSGSRLLTVAEEHQLSEGIQDLLKLEKLREVYVEHYGNQPTFAQWADAADVDQKILSKRLKYGIQCKEKMIVSNMRLVVSIAKKFCGVGMDIQDLVLPRMIEEAYKVKAASKQLYCDTGRHPKSEEVSEVTGLTMKRLEAVLLAPKSAISLDQKTGFNLDLNPLDVIADPDEVPVEELLTRRTMMQDLEKVLNTLRWNERHVIRLRFGLGNGRTKTLQEIGESMGVSRERIRQIELTALRKLKNKRRSKHLQQYAATCAG